MRAKIKELIDLSKVDHVNNTGKRSLVYMIISMVGIISGMLCETINNDEYSTYNVVYDEYLIQIQNSSFFKLFLNCALLNSLFVLLLMITGLCAVGSLISFTVPYIKGLGIGAVCSYFYSAYALKGVLFCLIFVIPASLLQLDAIILAASESSLMSGDILTLLYGKENENIQSGCRLYILRFCVIMLFILISAVVYALMGQLSEIIL